MGKIIVSEFVTLDDVMQGPGPEPGFSRANWNIPFMNEEAEQYKIGEIMAADVLLLGKNTYVGFAAAWPSIDAGEFSKKINSMRKCVVSTTLSDDDLTWENTVQIKDDVVNRLKALKEESGDIIVNGSATLVQTLVQNDLVDEYRLQVHPIILGEGKRLFQEGLPQSELELTESKTLSNGLLLLTYVPKR